MQIEPDDDVEFYFNLATGEVERGKLSAWTKRMGPYPTREAAHNALEHAQKRSESWDEADRLERQERDLWADDE